MINQRWRFAVAIARMIVARLPWLATASLITACGSDAVTTINPVVVLRVGGTVSGLFGNGGLVLQNNGGEDLTISANGKFAFPASFAPGTAYAVTVKTQPTQPPETCAVTAGSGKLSTNVTSVAVTCSGVPVVTAVGTAAGTTTTASIGPAGGSLTSSDSRFTLSVPPGAVASTTAFTIQPITNNAPGGIGTAYRLGPDGEKFSIPVELTWNYSQSDLQGTSASLFSVAFQDPQGHWLRYNNGTLDTAKNTFTITTDHFTDDALSSPLKLHPQMASVGLNQPLSLGLVYCPDVMPAPLVPNPPPQVQMELDCYDVTQQSICPASDKSCPSGAVQWSMTDGSGGVAGPLTAGQTVSTDRGTLAVSPDSPAALYLAPATSQGQSNTVIVAQVGGQSLGALITILPCNPVSKGIPPYCRYRGSFDTEAYARGLFIGIKGTITWVLQTDPNIIAQTGSPVPVPGLGLYTYTVESGTAELTQLDTSLQELNCTLGPTSLPLTFKTTVGGIPSSLAVEDFSFNNGVITFFAQAFYGGQVEQFCVDKKGNHVLGPLDLYQLGIPFLALVSATGNANADATTLQQAPDSLGDSVNFSASD